mmetsp:Transcript_19656/g.23573  ORF Transcript_19656/g.23573 Transcript_19656/m.23573 type:complete len:117 (+) Transcript_19656:77-427(+)|eukprot:CAMPEP_0197847944 /NCGR_PEP_ID=MMETSP1438-20131217/7571_1 /TAXON_ID=1461541 /ORGANISM="Pterosperma sp., Strain CCMP1384" /LENGTH=116 /DNA_ID=CAMNT_0043460027 /DNA_START=75 /DNA_END=425 /DNA_ORIENTATION=-
MNSESMEKFQDQALGMWSNFNAFAKQGASLAKQGALSAKDAATVTATKTKLQAEIKYLERELKLRKEKLGVDIYEPLVTDNQELAAALLAECKRDVDEIQSKIGAKQTEVDILNAR